VKPLLEASTSQPAGLFQASSARTVCGAGLAVCHRARVIEFGPQAGCVSDGQCQGRKLLLAGRLGSLAKVGFQGHFHVKKATSDRAGRGMATRP
jgi:hypothetical protein